MTASTIRKQNPYFDTLLESRMNPSGYTRQDWDVAVPAKVTLEHILHNPGYWKQVAKRLHIYDVLRILPDDCSFYAELLVLQVQPGVGAVTALKYVFEPETAGAKGKREVVNVLSSKADDYEVKWGGFNKWQVTRIADGVVISKGHGSEAEANAARDDHVQSAMA